MTSRMNVVPRSSPSITSRQSTPAPGMSGTSMCRQSARWPNLSLRASRSAPHMARASLAISEGWTCCPPMLIHREAPFWVTPTPWMSVRQSPTTETASSGYARARNSFGDERAATHISGRPTQAPSSCLEKSE
jgi:hypothetical protein